MAAISQFTPRQVLEAGRRAEGEGKTDYAIQFYQHLLTHHASSNEAIEADETLRRLTEQGAHASGLSARSGYPMLLQGREPYHQAQPRSPAPAQPPNRLKPRQAGLPSGAKTGRRRKPQVAEDGPMAAHAGRRPKRYRLGRFMAHLIGFTGLVAAITGLVGLGANFTLWITKVPNGLLSVMVFSPIAAFGALAVACVLILLAQMAIATFDASGGLAVDVASADE